MAYRIIYCIEYDRIIQATIMDAKYVSGNGALQGFDMKAIFDAEVAKVTTSVVVYKIETTLGVMVGYFGLNVGNSGQTATKIIQTLRPAFQSDAVNINQIIANFVTNGSWKGDYL